MKERPIIFSGPMVRAILDGRKTQTRMVVKPQPECVNSCGIPFLSGGVPVDYRLCHHGSVGGRLWVKETFAAAEWFGDHYEPAGNPERRQALTILYRATEDESLDDIKEMTWKPSIHMPRWASRITLEITGVRVERLQEISEEDAKAEGIEPSKFVHKAYQVHGESMVHYVGTAKEAFECLWESIHAPGSWDANPWVWVIEFKRITN